MRAEQPQDERTREFRRGGPQSEREDAGVEAAAKSDRRFGVAERGIAQPRPEVIEQPPFERVSRRSGLHWRTLRRQAYVTPMPRSASAPSSAARFPAGPERRLE